MDYLGSKCPVCNQYFHADDDVVVCPDCGTPHHRECWDAIGRCYNQARHAQGFTYPGDEAAGNGDVIVCRSCGKENEKTQFFCKYCAAPLSKEDDHSQNSTPSGRSAGQGGIPFGADAAAFMDPLGGIPADTDMGDGVTAGELAKYVKQNTPYFLRVFQQIKTVNHSRFSFCAALFGGGYLLYRKMYKIGAILTALQFGMLILSAYITIRYQSSFDEFTKASSSAGTVTQMLDYFSKLTKEGKFILFIPSIINLLTLALRIVIGFTANRLYFKHSKQQITRIKSASTGENPENTLQTRGGVNMPLAISLLVTYMLIQYLPGVITGIF